MIRDKKQKAGGRANRKLGFNGDTALAQADGKRSREGWRGGGGGYTPV